MSEKDKNYEVISGDGSDLDISPVYEHLNAGKPKCKDEKRKNIVIPQPQKKKDSNSKNS